MPEPEVVAYVRAALPPPPARVLEIGAGDGTLAAALRDGGYDVVAIDPQGGEGILAVPLHLLEPGAPLVADELDSERLDERAAAWWLAQRRAAGFEHEHTPAEMVAEMRG